MGLDGLFKRKSGKVVSAKADKKGDKQAENQPGFLARVFSDRDTKIYNLVPCLILALYSLLGGGVFYAIEKNICRAVREREAREMLGNNAHAHAVFQALRNDSCIKTFEESLYFAGTVYTTIGYGTVVTCCGASRVVTVIYALIGIPLTFVTLERMGRFMAAVVNGVYLEVLPHARELKKRFCKCNLFRREGKAGKSAVPAVVVEALEEREFTVKKREFRLSSRQALPLWLAAVLITTWMFGMAAIIAAKESWGLMDGLYFTMVTVTTIGFGDMHQTKFKLVFLYQLLMIFGLALFSMLVNLVQRHIDIMTDTIMYRMRERYKERLMAEESEMGVGRTAKEIEFMKLAKESDPAYFRFLMGRNAKDRLAHELEAQIRMRNTRVQTDDNDQRNTSTQTREDDLYRGQMIWAKRKFLLINQAKARAAAEPKQRYRPRLETSRRVETPEPDDEDPNFLPSPRVPTATRTPSPRPATKGGRASSPAPPVSARSTRSAKSLRGRSASQPPPDNRPRWK